MAIVVNKADSSLTPRDKPLTSYNRAYAGEPNGAVTPQYAGEIVLDTTNNALWKAMGVATSTWVTLTTPF